MFLIFSFATIHIFLKIRVPLSRIPLYSYAYLGISAFQYVSQPLTSLYTVVFSIASFIFAHLFYKQNDATIKAASNHSHFLSAKMPTPSRGFTVQPLPQAQPSNALGTPLDIIALLDCYAMLQSIHCYIAM